MGTADGTYPRNCPKHPQKSAHLTSAWPVVSVQQTSGAVCICRLPLKPCSKQLKRHGTDCESRRAAPVLSTPRVHVHFIQNPDSALVRGAVEQAGPCPGVPRTWHPDATAPSSWISDAVALSLIPAESPCPGQSLAHVGVHGRDNAACQESARAQWVLPTGYTCGSQVTRLLSQAKLPSLVGLLPFSKVQEFYFSL